jgi:hypothetical protein
MAFQLELDSDDDMMAALPSMQLENDDISSSLMGLTASNLVLAPLDAPDTFSHLMSDSAPLEEVPPPLHPADMQDEHDDSLPPAKAPRRRDDIQTSAAFSPSFNTHHAGIDIVPSSEWLRQTASTAMASRSPTPTLAESSDDDLPEVHFALGRGLNAGKADKAAPTPEESRQLPGDQTSLAETREQLSQTGSPRTSKLDVRDNGDDDNGDDDDDNEDAGGNQLKRSTPPSPSDFYNGSDSPDVAHDQALVDADLADNTDINDNADAENEADEEEEADDDDDETLEPTVPSVPAALAMRNNDDMDIASCMEAESMLEYLVKHQGDRQETSTLLSKLTQRHVPVQQQPNASAR